MEARSEYSKDVDIWGKESQNYVVFHMCLYIDDVFSDFTDMVPFGLFAHVVSVV